MMKYGNKIIAILLTAVCLIGVLPLTVFATTETIYIPPVAAMTPNSRFSASAGGYISDSNMSALTIPLPIDKTMQVNLDFGGMVDFQTRLFFLDSQYMLIDYYDISYSTAETIELDVNYTNNAVYVCININPVSFNDNLLINGTLIEVLDGDYTLASLERYEQVEIPEEPQEADIVANILELWQRILAENIVLIDGLYTALTKPIALLIGIPCCIALIGILLTFFGGKKR